MVSFKYSYALHHFRNAIESLATGPGDVRSRLSSAWYGHGHLRAIIHTDLPEYLQKDYSCIDKKLKKYYEKRHGQREIQRKLGKPDPDPVEATLARINNSTGADIAYRIFQIYDTLQNLSLAHQRECEKI
jgi:hypothetical protein